MATTWRLLCERADRRCPTSKLIGGVPADAPVPDSCEVVESQMPVLGVAVPYAIANVLSTVLGPIILVSNLVT